MKRLFLLFVLLLLSTVIFFGCSDDEKTDNPVTPGDLDDPDFVLFTEYFGGIDDANRDMFAISFGFIDMITSEKVGSTTAPKITSEWDSEYHEASGYWYCTMVDTNEYDEIRSYVDSIQFKEGATAVQWPDMDSLTQVRSYVTMTVTGPTIDTGIGHQNLVITVPNVGADTIIVNGSGDLLAEMSYEDIDGTDTTNCTMNIDYGVAINNLLYNTQYIFYEDEITCPRSGSVVFNGACEVACTGASEASLSGVWNVSELFADGNVTFSITHGDNIWTATDECGHPDFPEELGDEAAYDVFMEEFEPIEGFTGFMFSSFLEFAGILMEAGDQAGLDALLPEDVTMLYDGASKYWFCTHADTGYTKSLIVIDSIQFLHGDTAVRWPNNELVTEVRSGLRMNIEEPGIDTAFGFQLMTVTRDAAGSDTIIVNGTSGVLFRHVYVDTEEYEETYHTSEFDISADFTDLKFNMAASMEGGEAPCPFDGTANYTADVIFVASGYENWFVSGTWTVDEIFDNGTIAVEISNGSSTWNVENSCE